MTSRFTPAFTAALGDYITHVLRILELGDWEVFLKDEPCDDDEAFASIKTIYGRRLADLWLCHDFFDYSMDKQEHALIHELCHLLSARVEDVIDNGPETLLGKPVFTIFREQYRVANEHMTDQLASVLHFLLPGPNYDRLVAALETTERGELPPPTGSP